MDPNATLRLLEQAETVAEQADAYRSLKRWITSGGFLPDWARSELGTLRYRQFFARDKKLAEMKKNRHDLMSSLGLKRNRNGNYE